MMKNKTEEIKKKIEDLGEIYIDVMLVKDITDVFSIDEITDEIIESWKKMSEGRIHWEDYYTDVESILIDEDYYVRKLVKDW